MTWAQLMFFYCGVVVVPVTALLFARSRSRQKRSWWGGFLFGGVVTAGVCALSMVLAILLFPEYPVRPTDERGAVALTLPVAVTALYVLKRSHLQALDKTRRKSRAMWTAGGVYLAGLWLCYHATVTPLRAALPWGAAKIREWTWNEGFLPDFTTFLSARVSQVQFEEYVKRLKLESAGVEDVSWWRDDRAMWWRVPKAQAPVYRLTDGDYTVEATYVDGTIWVKASEQ